MQKFADVTGVLVSSFYLFIYLFYGDLDEGRGE